jgi:hypothetical protein
VSPKPMSERLKAQLHWLPMDQVTSIPDVPRIDRFSDRWWIANGRGEVLVYQPDAKHQFFVPQCNQNRLVVERLAPLYAEFGATSVIWIPMAFLPSDPRGY